MSRKIKVRAWFEPTKNYKKIYKEVYHKEPSDLYCEYFTEQDWLNASDENWADLRDFKKITFEQYTGLKDKNGKEIYEGDIVKCNDCVREVFFNPSEASFMFKNDRLADSLSRELFYSSNSEYEIIGNVHENPELLRRKKMDD